MGQNNTSSVDKVDKQVAVLDGSRRKSLKQRLSRDRSSVEKPAEAKVADDLMTRSYAGQVVTIQPSAQEKDERTPRRSALAKRLASADAAETDSCDSPAPVMTGRRRTTIDSSASSPRGRVTFDLAPTVEFTESAGGATLTENDFDAFFRKAQPAIEALMRQSSPEGSARRCCDITAARFASSRVSLSAEAPPAVANSPRMPRQTALQRQQSMPPVADEDGGDPAGGGGRALSFGESRRDSFRRSAAARRKANATSPIQLTSLQATLVRNAWKQVMTTKGPTVIGMEFFSKIFFKSPDLKDAFRAAVPPAKYTSHDSFLKAHYKGLADMVDMVVTNLESLELVAPSLEAVGQQHARTDCPSLTPQVWDTLAEVFIDSTMEWGDRRMRTDEMRKAWAIIVAFVTEKLKTGHNEQRRLSNAAAAVASRMNASSIF